MNCPYCHGVEKTFNSGMVDLARRLPHADIVILDKAIRCYPDMRTGRPVIGAQPNSMASFFRVIRGR